MNDDEAMVLLVSSARHHYDAGDQGDLVFWPGVPQWVSEPVAEALLRAHSTRFEVVERKPAANPEPEVIPDPPVRLRCLARRHYYRDRAAGREYSFVKGQALLVPKPVADLLLEGHPDKFELAEVDNNGKL